MKKYLIVPLLAIIILMAASATDTTYKKLSLFAQVYSYIKNSYVEDIPDEKLVYAAIRGMVDLLDPHSAFLTPEQYKGIKEDTLGEYAGIGLEVALKNNQLTVLSVMDDSPASRAGIKSGDIILEIDDKVIAKRILIDDIRKMLRGPLGSEIRLKIRRRPLVEPIVYRLIRERIRTRSVISDLLEGNIGYVRISSFQERTYVQVREAFKQMAAKGGGELRGVILDLRNNPGGLFEHAVRVADLFISEGAIVYTHGRGNKDEYDVEMAHPHNTLPNYPMLCLVNSGSASAAEIVAGALQDHKRAVIAGETTFGKGSIQTILELEDKSALKLTIARYLTPNKKVIQEVGIVPDVELVESPSDKKDGAIKERDLPGHLKNRKGNLAKETIPELLKKDNILYQAYKYLDAMIVANSKRKEKEDPE